MVTYKQLPIYVFGQTGVSKSCFTEGTVVEFFQRSMSFGKIGV
tara:strand:+ start:196 stop:324 length:129 start_codon:yes stop_codon:yes gene_type:complete